MSEHESSGSTARDSLFDLRTVIGGLFAIYGLVCVIWGFVSYTDADRAKTGGINVNLWAGLGMLGISAIFLVWAFTRPIKSDAPPEAADDPPTSA